MARRIQLRRDTAANWSSVNPLLAQGEIGLDLTNNKIKIGDGITYWNSLSYWDDKESDLSNYSGHIIPSTDNTYDLGSPTRQWRDIFVSDGSIYVGDIKLSNDNGTLLVQQVTDAGLVTEAPVPNTPGVVTTDRIINGEHSFSINADGTLSLDGNPFAGGASTGNITFSGYTMSSTTGPVKLSGGESSSIEIPASGSGSPVILYAGQDNAWEFRTDGSLKSPNNTIHTDQLIGTALVPNTPTLVFTSENAPWIGGVKLLLIAQGSLTGQSSSSNGNQWHTQMADAIIANRPWGNTSEPVMTVYGVTYTSTSAFVTYSVQKNATTGAIEVYATTAESTYQIRVKANATHVNAN